MFDSFSNRLIFLYILQGVKGQRNHSGGGVLSRLWGGKEKVSNTQCLHSPKSLNCRPGDSLCRDKANVVSLVNSENSQPESATGVCREAPGCKAPPPAQAESLLGARHAAQGVFWKQIRVPPLAPLHLCRPGCLAQRACRPS